MTQENLYGQDLVDQIRIDAGVFPGQFDPKSIEQRWDELDTLLLGSLTREGGTRLDGETAECVKRLLLAVVNESFVIDTGVLKRIESLKTVATPDPDVQLSLLGDA